MECSFEGCDLPSRTWGLCNSHASQRKRGAELTPLHHRLAPNEVIVDGDVAWLVLTDRKGNERARTQIDLTDLVRVRKLPRCFLDAEGYARYGKAGQRLHRFLAGTPDGMEADHINGDRLDNRSENLRNVTKRKQSQNRVGYGEMADDRNITFDADRQQFKASVQVDGRAHWVGRFNSLEHARKEARWARDRLLTHANEARHK